jgi:hypothetical protein
MVGNLMRFIPMILLLSVFTALSQPMRESHKTEQIDAVLLPVPPMERDFSCEALEYIILEEISRDRDEVMDDESWFIDHYFPALTFHNGGVNESTRGDYPPLGIDPVIDTGREELYLHTLVFGTQTMLMLYGAPPNRFEVVLYPRVLLSRDYATRKLNWALDFTSYAQGPDNAVDESVVFMALRWAEEVNGILYVSHAHRTYSESSGGLNAYITAIDLDDGSILWRSMPLVSNSQNFIVAGETIITGYGFTDEPDYIYLLDRLTGEVYESYSVRTSPDYFALEGNTLYVRCYDADYIFDVQRTER